LAYTTIIYLKPAIAMKKNSLEFICCPLCKGELSAGSDENLPGVINSTLICSSCRKEYAGSNGYVDFLGDKGLSYTSKRDKFMRSFYAKFYTPITNFMFLFCGGVKSARREVLSNLDLKDNSTVLETGMGAGENFLWMKGKRKNLSFFGIDIQKKMLSKCINNLGKWKIDAELFRADAEQLPFRNDKFDIVFHLGAINLFSDKKKAIDEMIRVAKPGTQIIIADETEKAGRLFNLFTGKKEMIIPPIDLVPSDMLNTSLGIIWREYGYIIKFSKP